MNVYRNRSDGTSESHRPARKNTTDENITDEMEGGKESILVHLKQLDHWTFLLAFAVVVLNIIVVSPYLSALAATLLLIALCYDVWEFSQEI